MAVRPVRSELHELVEGLPEEKLDAAKRYVEFLGSGSDDPMRWMFENAPKDDEPSSPEEDRTAEAAWQEYLRDGGVSSDDAKRALFR